MNKTMKKAFLMLALLVAPFALQAQTKFHDVEANDAKGAVKSITTSVMGQGQTVTFTPEGKMQQEGLMDVQYDADGYIQSAKVSAQGMEVAIKYTWENGRVASQSMDTSMGSITTKNVYDDKGELVKTVMDFGGQAMESPYSDYKYDDKGNWISRKGSMMGQEMEQTRKIEYYE